MASITSINIGSTADDGTGDTLRIAGTKMNTNATNLNIELIAATTKLDGIEANATADQTAAEEHVTDDTRHRLAKKVVEHLELSGFHGRIDKEPRLVEQLVEPIGVLAQDLGPAFKGLQV